MKKFFNISLVGVLLAVMLSACALAPLTGANDPLSVTEVQMYVIGVIASALLYGLKLLAKRFPKIVIKREWLIVLLYVVALGLSLFWGGAVLPPLSPFSDPVTFVSAVFGWITALLIALAPSVSFATLIYNILLKRIFDNWAGK
jgi:polyferredoxin